MVQVVDPLAIMYQLFRGLLRTTRSTAVLSQSARERQTTVRESHPFLVLGQLLDFSSQALTQGELKFSTLYLQVLTQFCRSLTTSNSDRADRGQRSYSLTASHHPSRLLSKTNRSATSLQSAGLTANGPHSPYQHPGRLRRPSARPGSPAWSDTHGAAYHRPNFSRPMPGPRTQTAFPFPPQAQQQQQPWPLTPQGYHGQGMF